MSFKIPSEGQKIRFKGGRILDKNFDAYLLPRFSAISRIQVVFADNATSVR